jgi:molybdopterin-guanine dinucleotide biosynthesis protein A
MMPGADVPSVRRAFLLVGHATRLPGKFLLPVEGEPILGRAARVLRAVDLDVTAVSVAPIELPGLPVLSDPYDGGPLGGLATILGATQEPFFLFGGDMPFLDPRSIGRMRREFDGRSVVPMNSAGEWEVLHAIYARLELARVTALLRRGAGVRDLVKELAAAGNVRFLPPGTVNPSSFTDLDTPEDYVRIRSPH